MKILDSGKDNTVNIDETVAGGISIEIFGNNNKLTIQKSSVVNGYKLHIQGNNCSIEIGESCMLNGSFRCIASNSHIKIGNRTTMMHAELFCHEAGMILVGEDCMFSGGIQICNSDMHSIIDKSTGKRINPAADIVIGNHVWLGQGVTVAKGCVIGSGSIAAAKAFVRGKVPENVVVAGVPAKIVKINVEWQRQLI